MDENIDRLRVLRGSLELDLAGDEITLYGTCARCGEEIALGTVIGLPAGPAVAGLEDELAFNFGFDLVG